MAPPNASNGRSLTKTVHSVFGEFGWCGEVTEDDLHYAQLAFLAANPGSEVVRKLSSRYMLGNDLVCSTLLLIVEDPSLAGILAFPYSLLGFNEDALLIEALSRASLRFAANMLFRVTAAAPRLGPTRTLDAAMLLVSSNRPLLQHRSTWGVCSPDKKTIETGSAHASRVGVEKPHAAELTKRIVEFDVDVTQIRAALKYGPQTHCSHKDTEDDLFDCRNANICYTAQALFGAHAPYFSPDCFLAPLLEFGTSKPSAAEAARLEAHGTLLASALLPLLGDPQARDNFMAVVENVLAQDRSKLVFDASQNCSDDFAFNLLLLVLRLAKAAFVPRFVARIGTNRFPTFAFFNAARLIDISVVRMVREIQSGEDSTIHNFNMSLGLDHIRVYLKFVFEVARNRRAEVYGVLYEAYLSQCTRTAGDRVFGTVDDFLDGAVDLLDLSLDDRRADSVSDVLRDASFVNAVLTAQLPLSEEADQNAVDFVSHLFLYKNTHKSLCLRVLGGRGDGLGLGSNKTLMKRMIRYYTDRTEDFMAIERFVMNKMLENERIDVDQSSLRMANAIVADLESGLSTALRCILEIKAYRDKGQRLGAILESVQREDGGDTDDVSDDEEAQVPDERLRSYLSLSKEERRDHITLLLRRDGRPCTAANIDAIEKDLLDALVYFRNPKVFRINSKLKVNEQRLENEEKHLRSTMMTVQSLLRLLLNFTTTNRRLFLNRNIFSRLCLVLGGALRDLVGRGSSAFKIDGDYGFDPRELLSRLAQIAVNLLDDRRELIARSALDPAVAERTLAICRDRFLLGETALGRLSGIVAVLGDSASGEGADMDDVPERFVDPLTCVIMEHPIRLSTSNVVIDRSTLRQIMLNDQIDPFNRLPIDESQCVPDLALEEEIRQFTGPKR